MVDEFPGTNYWPFISFLTNILPIDNFRNVSELCGRGGYVGDETSRKREMTQLKSVEGVT